MKVWTPSTPAVFFPFVLVVRATAQVNEVGSREREVYGVSDTCHILPLHVTTTAEEIGATRAFTNKHVTFFSVYTATGMGNGRYACDETGLRERLCQ